MLCLAFLGLTKLVAGTNSALLRLYGLEGGGGACRLLPGHTQAVLALAAAADGKRFASTSKVAPAFQLESWESVGAEGQHGSAVGVGGGGRRVPGGGGRPHQQPHLPHHRPRQGQIHGLNALP